MPRSVPEWIAATDDTPIPPRVKRRVAERQGGHCLLCETRTGLEGDHIVALADGGENRESNVQMLCSKHHKIKTAREALERTKVRRMQSKHMGIKKPKGRPLPGTRASGIRKRMSGEVERW